MLIHDLETLRVLEVNKAAVKYYGYSRAEFLKMRVSKIISKEEDTRLNVYAHSKRQNLHYSGEWSHSREDGEVIFADITSHKLTYKGHKAAWIVIKEALKTNPTAHRAIELERKRRREAETLQKAAAALTSSLDVEQILASLLRGLSQVIPYSTCAVLIREGDYVRVVSAYGYVSAATWVGRSYRIEGSMAKYILEARQPVVLADVEADRGFQKWDDSVLIRGWLGVPLIVRNRAIGCLTIDSDTPNAYDETHAELAMAFANQAATAIENARRFEAIRRNAQEFKALYQMTHEVSTQQNTDLLLQTIVERAAALLHSPVAGFYLFDSEREELELSFFIGVKLPTGTRLKLGEGAAGKVALSRKPLTIKDYQAWKGQSAIYKGVPFRAVLDVPMLYGGELIGVLAVNEFGESQRQYTQNDADLLSLFATHAASAVHSARLFRRLEERVQQLSILHSIDMVISSSTDLPISLQSVLDSIIRLLKIDAADILLYNPDTLTLEYASGAGFHSIVSPSRIHLGDNLAGRVALKHQALDIPDLTKAELPLPFRQMIEREDFHSYRCIPLIAKGDVKGVLELYHRSALSSDPEWTNLLNLLSGQAAIAIDNARLFSSLELANTELEFAYDATIEGWSLALELRDYETSGHSRRVLETTIALARKVGIPNSEIPNIRRGVLLHDIGKMGVPDKILLKPGPLDEEEWKIMRQHPLYAYDLLSKITYLQSALDIPYCHHEKWDGSGYPRGLKGEQIPLYARIFSVIDVYDGLLYDRPYRSAWPKEKVIEHIKEQSGRYFDPRMVVAFLEIV